MDQLTFAIQMEYDGRDYYLNQAKICKDTGLKAVFELLAEEEAHHAWVLENKRKGLPYELKNSKAFSGAEGIFKGEGKFKVETKDIPDQLDAYRKALDMEQKSIDLYTEKLAGSADPSEKSMYAFLIKQEQEHYDIFDGLILLLNRANEWVEDAEFGNREDY